jgi:hypothetical protein
MRVYFFEDSDFGKSLMVHLQAEVDKRVSLCKRTHGQHVHVRRKVFGKSLERDATASFDQHLQRSL